MAMQQLREKQKLIYWIIAILVIPTFVLFWGGGSHLFEHHAAAYPVARIHGKEILSDAFYRFRERIFAVCGRIPLRFLYGIEFLGQVRLLPHRLDGQEGYFSSVVALACLEEADRLRLAVSDREVGTFIRNHPLFQGEKDEKRFQENFRQVVEKTLHVTPKDYKEGVREYLKIMKFVDLLDSGALATPESAFVSFSQKEAKYTFARYEITSDSMRESILTEWEAKDPKEVESRIQAYLAAHPDLPEARTPARWRFEYVLAPFEVPGFEPTLTDAEIRAHFEENKERYRAEVETTDQANEAKSENVTVAPSEASEAKEAPNMTSSLDDEAVFSKVASKIREELLQDRRHRAAMNTIQREVEHYIQQCLASDRLPNLEEMTRLQILSRRGIQTGNSGKDPITSDDIGTLPLIGDSKELSAFLDELDRRFRTLTAAIDRALEEEKRKEAREAFERELQKYQKIFAGPLNAESHQEEPLRCAAGLFKIRILEYIPGSPRTLRNAKGDLDTDLFSTLKNRLIAEEATRRARDKAEEVRRTWQKALLEQGDLPPEFKEQIQTDTRPYVFVPPVLRAAKKGMVLDPQELPAGKGYELLVLLERTLPSRETFLQPEKRVERDTAYGGASRRLRSSVLYAPHHPGILQPHIRMGARFQTWLHNALTQREIEILKPLLPHSEERE